MQGRIHKVIAASGLASRRGAEDLVRAGRVTVDGKPAEIGQTVDTAQERIVVDGKPLTSPDAPRSYWVMNKPAGVVSTVRDRHAARTVLDLLPGQARDEARLYPVGRLDEESEGLLLLTNDGAWADLLLHPRYAVEREYMVGLVRSVTKKQRVALKTGVDLEEGTARFDHLEDATPAKVRKLLELLEPPHDELRWYRVVLAQGWKRQIRRMFDVVGQPVVRLVRVRIGTLKLAELPPGQSRPLDRREIAQLASCARRETSPRPPKATPAPAPSVDGKRSPDGSGGGHASADGEPSPDRTALADVESSPAEGAASPGTEPSPEGSAALSSRP